MTDGGLLFNPPSVPKIRARLFFSFFFLFLFLLLLLNDRISKNWTFSFPEKTFRKFLFIFYHLKILFPCFSNIKSLSINLIRVNYVRFRLQQSDYLLLYYHPPCFPHLGCNYFSTAQSTDIFCLFLKLVVLSNNCWNYLKRNQNLFRNWLLMISVMKTDNHNCS